MNSKWLYPIVGILFLFLAYLSSVKGDQATAGVFTVIGIIFISGIFQKS
jgi:hypothetical protein